MSIYEKFGRFDNLTVGICGDLKYGRTVHSLMTALKPYKSTRFVLISPQELGLPEEYASGIGIEKTRLTLMSSLDESLPELDVLYMTRVQKERFKDYAEYHRLYNFYLLDSLKMRAAKRDMIVLHPLPRVNELSADFDGDPRAWYFKEAENAFYGRMALILKLLNWENY
jgi:aspartate carbamoyltransferase catalytic subunit